MASPSEVIAALEKARASFPRFSTACLKIRDMAGVLEPLAFNRAQVYAHNKIEEQLQKAGMVRALVLKGRKQGVSTYTGSRFYHKTSLFSGRQARVIAHKQSSSDDLFEIVERFHKNNPLAPATETANAKEIKFAGIDSGYKVGTAGSDDIGRGGTSQLLHASEFAFWKNANEHMAGLGNVVARVPGTEIIIESTANGIGNVFHQLWQLAEAGEGDYIPIFIPWFWEPRYTADVPEDFDLTDEEEQYRSAYKLTLGQMAWRRLQRQSYGHGFEWLFDQEFPATPQLAFQSSTGDPYISPLLVSAGMNSGYYDEFGPLIIGVDPAEGGKDRTAIVFRRGRVVFQIRTYRNKDTMQVTGIVAKIIDEFHPDAVFVDKIGIGAGIYSRLRELGHGQVFGFVSGERAAEPDIYANKRAEAWARMKKWLEDAPVRLPKSPELASDLSAPGYDHDSAGKRLLLESKKDMAKRGVRSPDIGDALAFTFADFIGGEGGDNRGGNPGHRPATRAGY